MILRSLRRPRKSLGLLVLAILLGCGAYFGFIEYKVAAMVRPMFGKLAEVSASHDDGRTLSVSGVKWHGTYRLSEVRMNGESHQIIKDALKAAGWNISEEANVVLMGGMTGGFMIRADQESHTLLAHLPKPGGELRVDIARTGQPEVSKPSSSLHVSGR